VVPLRRTAFSEYGIAVLVVILVTLLVRLLFGTWSPADAVALYLLGEVAVSFYLSRGPALLAAVLSVLAFDFFVIPPYYQFAVHDLNYITTFAVMLLVGAVISALGHRSRSEARLAREGERRTQLLLRYSRELAGPGDRGELLRLGAEQLGQSLDADVALFEVRKGRLTELQRTGTGPDDPVEEEGVVRWVWQNRHEAGMGTGTLPGSAGLYLPLLSADRILAVAAISPKQPETLQDPTGRWLLDALVAQLALALERIALAEERGSALLAAEREELRSTLFGAVSHDLRTPLALIRSTAETLQDEETVIDAATRRALLRSLWEEARHLESRVRNLLDLTRLETGVDPLRREPEAIEELFEVALREVEDIRQDREVRVELAADLPLISMDALLMEQVIVNLLENALRYAPGDSPIELRAAMGNREALIEVADRGPGIPEGERERVFQRFHRLDRGGVNTQGIGLGLTICRAVVSAHGGRIWVEGREGGGALFRIALPAPAASTRRDGDPDSEGEPDGRLEPIAGRPQPPPGTG
jgi:two-component system sensor histidine kinase KdpD